MTRRGAARSLRGMPPCCAELAQDAPEVGRESLIAAASSKVNFFTPGSIPVASCFWLCWRKRAKSCRVMARLGRLELPAYRFEVCRSIHLSYRRVP